MPDIFLGFEVPLRGMRDRQNILKYRLLNLKGRKRNGFIHL